MIRVCFAALLLSIALSIGAADGEHAPEPEGYWTGPNKGAVPATLRGGKVIHADEVIALLKRPGTVVIDVDSAPNQPAGLAPGSVWMPPAHPGIPGSIWIPGAGLGQIPAPLDAFFRERLARATANDLDRPLIIYCHERCWLSWNAARRAIGYGYRNVHWFPEGLEGWRAAGQKAGINKPETPS